MNVRMNTQHSDTLQVITAAAAYFSLTLVDVDTVVRIVGGLVTIWFVCYKLYKETKK